MGYVYKWTLVMVSVGFKSLGGDSEGTEVCCPFP